MSTPNLQPTHVFYVPGATNAIDQVHPVTGRSVVYDRTLDEVQRENSGAQVVSREEALRQIDAALRAEYVRPPTRVTAKQFDDALNVLPPCRWTREGGFEVFHVSERVAGDLVDWYVRIGYENTGATYYRLTDRLSLDVSELLRRCREA